MIGGVTDRAWAITHRPVTAIRSLFAQRHLAVFLCTVALLLRLIVPSGYMIGTAHGRVAIVTCPGSSTAPASPMAMPRTLDLVSGHGSGHDHASAHAGPRDHRPGHEHGGTELPCAFAGLSAPALAAADPIPWASPIPHGMPPGTLPVVPARVPAAPYQRPPLRGPPALS